MNNRVLAFLMALFLAAGACLAADKPITDNRISDNVRIKLASDQVVKGGGINVEVKDGVVTLSGSVELERQKVKAAKLAKKVKGVKQVVNSITVQRPK